MRVRVSHRPSQFPISVEAFRLWCESAGNLARKSFDQLAVEQICMGLVLLRLKVYSLLPNITIYPVKGVGSMVKKLLTLLFTSLVTFSLSVPMLAQLGSKDEEAKETPAQEKAEKENKEKARKRARWDGIVTRSKLRINLR